MLQFGARLKRRSPVLAVMDCAVSRVALKPLTLADCFMAAKLFTLAAVPGGGIMARSADVDDDIAEFDAAVAKAWRPLLQF